jgi:bacillithiol synthase
MTPRSRHLSYSDTQFFSPITTAYLSGSEALRHFYAHAPTPEGIQAAIAARQNHSTDRGLLHEEFTRQYTSLSPSSKVAANIAKLLQPNTYTICTAHQPNIFTGHLYFIYKIIHAIKLADALSASLPQYQFVPVYYMGSEDADLEELGEVTIDGMQYQWHTTQTGAVGRMKVDQALLKIIDAIAGQLMVLPHGEALMELLRGCYAPGNTIEQATFQLVHTLFAEYGLLIFLPDNARYKQQLIPVFKDDLLHHTAETLVQKTSEQLEAAGFKAQAFPRHINLFYLRDNSRERIEKEGNQYRVHNTDLLFSETELLQELEVYPERFSPNVILRGLFQETLLPNIAFIGGGGELAYWLQLKAVFTHYNVPYPVQVLRNSFVLINEQQQKQWATLQFDNADYFLPENELLNRLVKRETNHQLSLAAEKEQLTAVYLTLQNRAEQIDITLIRHIEALKIKALQKLEALEKKLLRAEKRKFEAEQRHIHTLKAQLFPRNSLQERIDNMLPYYAVMGKNWIQMLYEHALTLEQQFTMLETGSATG